MYFKEELNDVGYWYCWNKQEAYIFGPISLTDLKSASADLLTESAVLDREWFNAD